MALTISNATSGDARARTLYSNATNRHLLHRPRTLLPLSPRISLHVVSAKKLSPRTGRFDSKNRRNEITSTEEEEGEKQEKRVDVIEDYSKIESVAYDGDGSYFLPDLPGDKPSFWEGEQWEPLGFFVQYMWAFGIVFALVACGIAVATYNEGATDFKSTPVYKEAVGSPELLEEPESSNSDVFEANPTEVAPSLD
ncbi:hypothetical protein CFOL_v3_25256 [Cephalotus follicularis]|uniref:Uncharacterized protein n=1 Tax=Cephalotus follicularis TaxID=3775 RepID=A0A1Q3CP09_CEPFO|nr:hypothetical protein CFOL_v3_25256 [Cephalotus follicularis]